MNEGGTKLYKILLSLFMAAMLVVVSFFQNQLVSDRGTLGLTRVTPLENAPPILAFTTVALGGFRGLIANALWVRAMELQDDSKYFEMVQLADWITKLQPYFTSVWVVQAWNLAYNISIKFNDPVERWNWVRRGIELLRDEGLKYNPKEPLLYRELAWFFQHKMGQNLDDAHMYFKQVWGEEFGKLFPDGHPNYAALEKSTSEADKTRLLTLKNVYKMDLAKMKEVDEKYGPLEWRLPETHAIYWAHVGLQLSKKEELITLRRVIYQSMQLAFQRGRLIENSFEKTVQFGPNLAMIPNANKAYEEQQSFEPEMKDHIGTGHKNFLLDAVYLLYVNNQKAAAQQWFTYVKEKYPEARLVTPSLPIAPMTLDDYAVSRLQEELGDTSMDKTKAILEGILSTAYFNLAIGEDDQFVGLTQLAEKAWNKYTDRITIRGTGNDARIGLADMNVIKRDVLTKVLDPEKGMSALMAAQLRTRLKLSATDYLPAPKSTNAVAAPVAPQKPQ